MAGHTQLKIWLENNGHRRFDAPTRGRVWHRVYEAFSGNGGRMGMDFEAACVEFGFDVRPSAHGGFVFGKV